MTDLTNMSLHDWLDDLSVRFLLNLPQSELASIPRLCFQVEEAQWFYEDFIRPLSTSLLSLPLRQFCIQLFRHCPLLSSFTDEQHLAAYEEFLAYKVRVPVRGAILMNEDLEKVVLVKGWKKGASWSFPRGKINKDEKDLDCAIREVYEETGYNVRAAGLVSADEEKAVKYIDVTMREQHMRLFVFRGVKEDTVFEPQTRKEISKIDWYNVRDLPGFKKHGKNAGHDPTGMGSKFYMVAPFLGPLKKWISQQKRNDVVQDAQIAAPGSEMAHAHIDTAGEETEGYTELEVPVLAPEPVAPPVDKSAELRRLMGLDLPTQPSAPAQAQRPQSQATNGAQPKDLLALLRGGPSSTVPQTPLEQINAFPQQPETPQPHHPRHPSMGGYQQQPVPQFPFSPQGVQLDQQRHSSVPTPSVFGPNRFPAQMQQQAQGFPQHAHSQMFPQHQQQQRASMPTHNMPGPGVPFGVPQRQPMQPPFQMPTSQIPQQPSHFPRSSDAFLAPGQGSGRPAAVPKADALPMPRLNAHSLNLLNAFKAGNASKPGAPGPGVAQETGASRQGSQQHQTALLDLFRKPSQPTPAMVPEPPASPTGTDTTDRTVRPTQKERKATLNEITRTLPARFKAKSPTVAQSPDLQQQLAVNAQVPAFKSQPEDFPTLQQSQVVEKPLHIPVPVLHRPQQQKERSPKPARLPRARGGENGAPVAQPQPQQQVPAFTILPRPASVRGAGGLKSPALEQRVPGSPLRHQTPLPQQQRPPTSDGESASTFQPRVLRRPESVDPATVQAAAEVVEQASDSAAGGADKKGQLLALFGKADMSSPPPAPAQQPAANGAEANKNNLLGLFTAAPGSQAGRTASAAQTPTSSTPPTLMQPPPAPAIQPERKRSSQTVQTVHHRPQHHQRQQTPQNALLDLFTKPSAASKIADHSPGTPISPFTLGTPVQMHAPRPLGLHQASQLGEEVRAENGGGITPTPVDGARSRLGSLASSGEGESRRASGAGTPVEAKGFLLDYLRGVVSKEGGGSKRGQS